MSLKDDGSKSLMTANRSILDQIIDLDKRVSRLEKLVIAAIATNLPQLLQIIFGL